MSRRSSYEVERFSIFFDSNWYNTVYRAFFVMLWQTTSFVSNVNAQVMDIENPVGADWNVQFLHFKIMLVKFLWMLKMIMARVR